MITKDTQGFHVRLKRFVLAITILLIFFMYGCGSGDASHTTPKIDWSASTAQGAQSATFIVPMNTVNDDGSKISLALRRYQASGVKKGSIIFNPGGPGASAVDYLDYFAVTSLGQRLRENFDLVAFDPRGVGHSTIVRCVDNPLPYVSIDRNPQNELEYQLMIATVQDYTARCAENNGELLEHVSTMDVVRDMELIRQAMGEGKLNYIGLSYGTKIGALYADTYPQNVRAMALDGVFPPSLTLLDVTLEQTAGFEKSLQAFLTACAQNNSCPFGAGNPEQALTTLMANLKQQPIPAGDRVLTYGQAQYAVMSGLYDQYYWPQLEHALATAQAGDGSKLLTLTNDYFWMANDGSYPNLADAFYAVTCTDFSAPSAAEVQSQIETVTRDYPFFGAMSMNDILYCTYWPAAPGLQPQMVSAAGAPQIMVVGTTGDPATPYAWSQRLASELDSSFLVTLEAERHVAAGTNSCVDDRYEQYLLHPDAGFSDLTCSE